MNNDISPKPSLFWRIIRWLPLVTLGLTAGGFALLFILGGMYRVISWGLFLLFFIPLLGMLWGIPLTIYALVALYRRRVSPLLWVSWLGCGIFLLPIWFMFSPIAYPADLTQTTPAVTVRLPAAEPLRVFWGGNTIEQNYHALDSAQRWSYDLGVDPYLVGSEELTAYGCYGIPILAPAAGEVAVALDGEPDMTPGVLSANYANPAGNYVALRLAETDTYLIIAHLKQGSVAVKVGDVVTEGQFLGECGNSGNTSEPHIHIHHQRQNPAVIGVNFAEGLPLYFRDHNGSAMPVGGITVDGETVTPIGDVVQHIQK